MNRLAAYRRLLCLCFVLAPILVTSVTPAQHPALLDRANKATRFLLNEHDRWISHVVVSDDRDSGGQMFFPNAWAGDIDGLSVQHVADPLNFRGTTALQIGFKPSGKVRDRWASISWTYPDFDIEPYGNWGTARGHDLDGCTELTGWIRGSGNVKLEIGGINTGVHHNPVNPHQDEFKVTKHVKLPSRWTSFGLTIPEGASAHSVIGGFTVGFDGPATVYLDELAYVKSARQQREDTENVMRFIRSYVPQAEAEDDPIRNVCFLYDQSICLVAFCVAAEGKADTVSTISTEQNARLLANTLCWTQCHDRTYTDGRWRNGYAPGPIEDEATKKARIPGIWRVDKSAPKRGFVDEDQYVVSPADTGNLSWAAISLLAAHATFHEKKYRTASIQAAEWVDAHHRANDKFGGYSGGYEGRDPDKKKSVTGPTKLGWRSVEHNLDYFVLCKRLSRLADDPDERTKWQDRADHAKRFVFAMWRRDHFLAGKQADNEDNLSAIPADAQTWAFLAMAHDPEFRKLIGWTDLSHVPQCLQWVDEHCRVKSRGYKFSDRGSGCWPEGACHLAAAYHHVGRIAVANGKPDAGRTFQIKADRILYEVALACPDGDPSRTTSHSVSGPYLGGGIAAAYPGAAETGFIKDFGGGKPQMWVFRPRVHAGATAWFVLAAHRTNPYWFPHHTPVD